MALTGRRVLLLASLAAALIAIALLPPSPDWWDEGPRRLTDTPTRVALLDRAIRRAETRARLLTMRDSAAPLLARRPPGGTARPTLVLTDALSPPQRRAVAAAWDSVTADLGPAAAGTGVRLRVLASDAPEATLYLLPEATGGEGCVVVVELGRWRRDDALIPRLLRRAVGPCAYYHAFGPPGPHIRAWLARSGFHPAQEADWTGAHRASRRRADRLAGDAADLQRVVAAVWEGPYLDTPEQTSCAAGRLASCAGVLDAAEGPYHHQRRWPRLETQGVFARQGPLALWWAPAPGFFFADLVHDHGRERFARFWRSSLPVDSAFATAFGVPLDRYVSAWLGGDRTVRLGSSIRTSSVLLSLLFAVVVVGAGAVLTARRQVT